MNTIQANGIGLASQEWRSIWLLNVEKGVQVRSKSEVQTEWVGLGWSVRCCECKLKCLQWLSPSGEFWFWLISFFFFLLLRQLSTCLSSLSFHFSFHSLSIHHPILFYFTSIPFDITNNTNEQRENPRWRKVKNNEIEYEERIQGELHSNPWNWSTRR